jgi:hypothetical protein
MDDKCRLGTHPHQASIRVFFSICVAPRLTLCALTTVSGRGGSGSRRFTTEGSKIYRLFSIVYIFDYSVGCADDPALGLSLSHFACHGHWAWINNTHKASLEGMRFP